MRRQGVGDQRDETHGAAQAHRDEAAAPVGEGAPPEEGDRRRHRGQDPDDADVAQRQVQPVDVDEGVQRRRSDQAASVEPLGERDAAEDRSLAQGAQGITCRERARTLRGLGAQPDIADRAGDADDPGERDGAGSADPISNDPAAERGECARGRPTHAQEADHATAHPGRVDRAPQAQVERPSEREAEPEGDRHEDHDRRAGDDEQHQQRGGSEPPDDRQLERGTWAQPTGEDTQQVGHERCGRQRGETERLDADAPRNGRQQGRDERRGHPDADGREEIEGEVARDRRRGRRTGE